VRIIGIGSGNNPRQEGKFSAEALRASRVPGANRTGERSVAFASDDFMDIIKYFRLARP
jgi:D-aminopeptidase